MTWNIFSMIPLIAFIAYISLLSIVIWRGPRTKPVQIFILYLMAMVIWSLGSFLMHLDPPLGTPLFWNKFLAVGTLAMPILFYYFIRTFLGIRKQKIWLYLGAVFYIFFLTANVMGYIVKEAYTVEGVFYYKMGPAAPFIAIDWFLFVALAAFNLIQRYRKTKDSFYRNRLKYLLMGILIMTAGVTTNLTKLGRYPLDILINTANAFLIAYVILRYKLLDINIVIRKSAVYFALTAVIAGVYLFMIFILERLLRGVVSISLVAILIAIGIALIFQPLRDFLQRWIDRLFFQEKFDYYQILKKFTQKMVTILDLDDLANSTVNTIGKAMQTDRAAILLTNKKEFNLKGSLGLDKSFASSFKLERDNPLLAYMAKKREILTRDDIDIIPQLKSLWESKIRELEMLKAELFIPLITKDNLIGIIILGKKLSEDSYSEEEYALLSTVAHQASVAFENARLYGEVRQSLVERKRLEEELRREHEELLRIERLRALGEMAGGVAHDFNNLLAAILGNTQLLYQRIGKIKPSEIKRRLKIIETSTLDGAETVKRIQEFSGVRIDKTFSRIDLGKVVRDAIEITKPRWKDEAQKKGATVTLTTRLNKISPIAGNASELREVLVNIIINAIDAMPEGGKITVETKKDKDQTCVSVTDTGPGMSEEVKRKVFDPYFTTKGPRATGLGMSVCHGIITRHAGKIKIDSRKGKGTTVTVKLPISLAKKEKEGEKAVVTPERIKKATILVVDDEKMVRDVLKDMLRAEGYHVISSSSAKEGIELFKKEKVDIVFTDLGMPEISGWQLAKIIKEINSRIPVVMITGWGAQINAGEAKEPSVDFFVNKPFQNKELLELVTKAIKSKENKESK